MKLLYALMIFTGLLLSRNNISAQNKPLKEGDMAPDIELPDVNGEILKLSSLRGRMVLIDFWASWCLPCHARNKDLVEIYAKYKDANFKDGVGFTVYSISLDMDSAPWKKAIRNDGLLWLNHVSDLKKWHSAAALKYNISNIPYNVLIDGHGKIVMINPTPIELKAILETDMRKKKN
jgi:peroxiredoxin